MNWRTTFSWESGPKYTIIKRYYGHHQIGGAYTQRKEIIAPSLYIALKKGFPADFPRDLFLDYEITPQMEDEEVVSRLKDGVLDNEEFSWAILENGKALFNPEEYSEGGDYFG